MIQLLRQSIVLFSLIVLAACAAPAPALLLDDSAALLDAQQISAAAAPLLAQGASVAIFTAAQGDPADFARSLAESGLLRSEHLAVYPQRRTPASGYAAPTGTSSASYTASGSAASGDSSSGNYSGGSDGGGESQAGGDW